MDNRRNIPIITIILIAINVILFFCMILDGSIDDGYDQMIKFGAITNDLVLNNHEYYRVFTSCFLHFDLEHLANNMVSLAILGYTLEKLMGRTRYLILYLLSGIISGVFSIFFSLFFENSDIYTVSAGASGAIYGLLGAMLVLLIFGNKEERKARIPFFLVFLVISLYNGFKDPSIGGDAHMGGLFAGFIICLIMVLIEKNRRKARIYES